MTQTLKLVDNLVHIVSEDATEPTQAVIDFMNDSGIKHVYLRGKIASACNF